MVNVTEPLSLDPTVYVVANVFPDPDTALFETADPPIFIVIMGVFTVSLAVTLSVITSFSFANVEVLWLEDKSTTVSVGTVVSMVTFDPDVISDCVISVAFAAVCIEDASIANVTVPSVSALSTVYTAVQFRLLSFTVAYVMVVSAMAAPPEEISMMGVLMDIS